jgi:16S rRNA (uracil1498-N3)-methyltransferase
VSRPRVFIDGVVGEDALTLTEEDHHYLTRVRRLPAGAEVEVVGSDGTAGLFRMEHVTAERVRLVLGERLPSRRLSGVLTLIQPLLQRKKLELAVQKATELGVDSIRLVAASRSVARWEAGELHHRLTRLDRIALEASRQCRRDAPPVIELLEGFDALEASRRAERRLVLAEESTEGALGLAELSGLPRPQRVVVAVGPEGGLTASEVEALRAAGFEALHLGPLVLRTETASLLACVAGGLALGRYARESS